MYKIKEKRGITLIALIITIIILLILASVTIITLTKENGLIEQIKNTNEEVDKGKYFEEINLEINDETIQRTNEYKKEKFTESIKIRLENKEWVNSVLICNESLEESEDGEILLIETKSGYEIIIYVDNKSNTASIKTDYFEKKINNLVITYDKNGGDGNQTIIQEGRKGFSIVLKENIYTKENYKFVGWCENKEGDGTRYLANSKYYPQNSITLYAIWEKDVAILKFDSNGGEGTMDDLEVSKGKETELPSNTYTRENYEFLKWNTKNDGTGIDYENNSKIVTEENITLYAIWEKNTLKVMFNSNGGEGTMQEIKFDEDTSTPQNLTLPKNVYTKDGYAFAGWDTLENGKGTRYLNGETLEVSSSITLYAQWVTSQGAYYVGTTAPTAVYKMTSNDNYYNGNYALPNSLFSMMKNSTLINNISNTSTKFQYIYSGTNTYSLSQNTTTNTWISVLIQGGGLTTSHYISNFKLVFSDGQTMTLSDAITNNYIDPLVICTSASHSTSYIFKNMSNVLTGGSTSTGNYCTAHIVFKVKNYALSKIQFYSNKAHSTTYDGLKVWQMPLDWKLSTTPW